MQRFPRYIIYHDVGVGKVGTKAYWKKKILTVQKAGMGKTMNMSQRLRLNILMVKKRNLIEDLRVKEFFKNYHC